MNEMQEKKLQAYLQKCLYCIFRDKQGTWCHKYVKNIIECSEFLKEKSKSVSSRRGETY